MPNTTTTPYMNLSLPIVGTEVGPQWAAELNTAFSTVDAHTHIPGQGLPIPTEAIQINGDLSFNTNYNLTNLRSLRCINQANPLALSSDINCVYVSGGNLYYNDVSGNQIQMTVGGAVNTSGAGSISGLGATTATVSYTAATKTFTFWSNTNTPAKMITGPIIFSQNTASPYTITLIPANAQAANYILTMPPSLPGSTGYMQVDTSGNLTIQGIVVPGTSDGLVSQNGLTGNTTASAISAGYVGQIIKSSFSHAAAGDGSVIVGQFGNLTSISLTAGHWLLSGQVEITRESGQVSSLAAISAYSGSTTTDHVPGVNEMIVNWTNATTSAFVNNYDIILTGSATYYFKGQQNVGTTSWVSNDWVGKLIAVRIA